MFIDKEGIRAESWECLLVGSLCTNSHASIQTRTSAEFHDIHRAVFVSGPGTEYSSEPSSNGSKFAAVVGVVVGITVFMVDTGSFLMFLSKRETTKRRSVLQVHYD